MSLNSAEKHCESVYRKVGRASWLWGRRRFNYEDAGDLPVYLCNDNGYTYGEINEDTMKLKNYND